jgi:hypothetical protein
MVDDNLINKLLENANESSVILKTSLKYFIKVFHFYLFRKEFIFKDFHNKIINALENRVFDDYNNNNKIKKTSVLTYLHVLESPR